MSSIEAGIEKLRKRGVSSPAQGSRNPSASGRRAGTGILPVGPKHHLDREELVDLGLLAPSNQKVSVADEFRRIKRPLIDNILRADAAPGDHMNLIMIASGYARAGKTFCAVNLAESISLERDLNVLLVDADIPRRRVSHELGLGAAPGLIDLLLNDSRELADVLVPTDLGDMQILPAGQSHAQATELLASERMSSVVRELALTYSDRVIILDSPPLLMTSEAQALARQVGQIVVVVEAGETSRESLAHTIETLNPEKAISLILNKCRHQSGSSYYGGYYGYEPG